MAALDIQLASRQYNAPMPGNPCMPSWMDLTTDSTAQSLRGLWLVEPEALTKNLPNPEAPTLIYPINKSLYTSRPAIIVTCLKHSVQKTTESCNQNVPGTATLEHTSTMTKCTEPVRLFKNTRKHMSSIISSCWHTWLHLSKIFVDGCRVTYSFMLILLFRKSIKCSRSSSWSL